MNKIMVLIVNAIANNNMCSAAVWWWQFSHSRN